jgi:hypothetical protein
MTPLGPPIRVLVVDDNETDRATFRRLLERESNGRYDVLDAATAADALRRVACERPDCLLLDYNLPDSDGLELLRHLREPAAGDAIPVVFLTGGGSESVAVEAMKRGAQDYLVKDGISARVLAHAIHGAIERVNLKARLKRATESLETQNRRLAELYETAHQFVDNVSHEFRTPLAVIKEFASIINDGLAGPVTGEQQEYLNIIGNRVDDLETMVNDMLDISKLESGLLGFYRRPCALADIVDEVRPGLQRKAAGAKVGLEISVDPSLPRVYGDPDKIGRVVINLVVNAIKFSSEGQNVRIWAEPDPDASQVTIGVTDEGPGIGTENLKQIFERFRQLGSTVRSSTKGFGLGLNIARELVRLNFGDMNVRSELGKGSTFSFTLPVAEVARFMPRYLAHVQLYRGENFFISLVAVSSPSRSETVDDVEPFLQHQIRRTDLIFPVSRTSWLLVVPTNTRDLGSLMQRIQKARDEANRNRPSGQLPVLDMHVEGTWRVDDRMDEFLAAFHAALIAKESVRA